ncbi:Metallo-dependent hydrolase [Lojkania enalia]|uniref:Metallo-dependent hydrolase n=1 Tax=Lojkania enalia TaxID=147567 RepID=A0A9P4K1D9_9PLEO|nr:Metallo-dependent hydrolase [Didymosphaeria enalia]
MPIDEITDISTGTDKPRVGRRGCGLRILSVRGRDSSSEDPNRPVMHYANQGDKKKRKRSSKSPLPSTRQDLPFKMAGKGGETKQNHAIGLFNAALEDSQAQRKYEKNRTQLVQTEHATSWDREARQSASPSEIKACKIILAIREFERDVLFGNIPGEALPENGTLDMGGQFLTNKSRIENGSKLFQIAKAVPKGAILHLHFNAELHPERLLQEARKMKNMFIRSTLPLNTIEQVKDPKTEVVFDVKPISHPSNNIFDPGYKGRNSNWKDPKMQDSIWMRWEDFCKEFKNRYGDEYDQPLVVIDNGVLPNSSEQGPVKLNPAEYWVKQKMVLSEDEAYGMSQTVNGVWARFNQATRAFKGLLNYEKVYRWYISNAIDRMIDEKVMYAELRPMLLDKFIPSTDGTEQIDNQSQMQIILECLDEKKKELESRGQLDLFPFGLKIVYCTPRSIPQTIMQREMRDCIKLAVQYRSLICGFDLVGAEDRPNHIGFYQKELVAFQKACKEEDLDIPFLFHAGETLLDTGGSKDPANSNLYDAVLLQAKRIGHGFSLLKHPHLIEKFRKTDTSDGICIELCPISNELLHLCRNIKEHPYPELLAAGIPCTVNSDNPSLFSNSMSHEFYQIMVGSPSITIHSWKQLAIWSLEYSCLSKPEKRKGLMLLKRSWKQFCEDIVDKYESLLTAKDHATGEGSYTRWHMKEAYGMLLTEDDQKEKQKDREEVLNS